MEVGGEDDGDRLGGDALAPHILDEFAAGAVVAGVHDDELTTGADGDAAVPGVDLSGAVEEVAVLFAPEVEDAIGKDGGGVYVALAVGQRDQLNVAHAHLVVRHVLPPRQSRSRARPGQPYSIAGMTAYQSHACCQETIPLTLVPILRASTSSARTESGQASPPT